MNSEQNNVKNSRLSKMNNKQIILTEKSCTRCKAVKPVSEFYKKAQASTGYSYYCKVCDARISSESRIRGMTRPKVLSVETRRKLAAYRLGVRLPKEHRANISAALSNEKNPIWKGDNASYSAVHQWVALKLGKPNLCAHCGATEAPRFEWANKSHEYKRDLGDWMRLCASCHRRYDWAHRRQKEAIREEKA